MNLDDLKNQIKLVSTSTIIGHYIALTKRGQNYVGICPFHNDTRPSLHIHDQKQIYKCFVCENSGDAITFVERFKSYDFLSALRDIGLKLGLDVESAFEKGESNPKLALAKKITEYAKNLYHSLAKHHAPLFNQFCHDRRIDASSVEKFELGLAPAHNLLTQTLTRRAREQHNPQILEVALELGLLQRSKRQPDQLFDTFRNRILFPIKNGIGETTGFSARALLPNQNPKYFNSPESLLFNKRKILYGYHLAREEIRRTHTLLLVEGNMDVIMLHQHGFTNAVAMMGVGTNEQALQQVVQQCKQVILALDSDPAGMAAARRVHLQLLSLGVLPKFLDFLPQKDPDEFLVAHGKEALEQRIHQARPFLEKIVAELIYEKNAQTTDQKIDLLYAIFAELAPLKEHLLCHELLAKSTRQLELESSPDQVVAIYQNFLKDRTSREKTAPLREATPPRPTPARPAPLPPKERTTLISRNLRSVLQAIICHPLTLRHHQFAEILDLIDQNEVKKLIHWLKELLYEVDDQQYEQVVRDCLNRGHLSDEIKDVVSGALFHYLPLKLDERQQEKLFADLKRKILKERLMAERKRLKALQKECATPEENGRIINQLIEIDRQVSNL